MEYPFKDLMPLDEVLEREGYYKDWTHLDPEVFYSLTQISEYIKTKGYGVDVRLLIAQLAEHFGLKTTQVVDLANLLSTKHDALKDQFDVVIRDATSGADWGGEIVLARGGKPTLQARLDETTAQLAQKANEITVRKKSTPITLNDLDGETLGIIQNGSGGTPIEILSIPREGSVTPDKTTFIEASRNIFNKSAPVLENTGLDHLYGGLLEGEAHRGYFTTGFINAKEDTDYNRSFQGQVICFYDENKEFIYGSGHILGRGSVRSPQNAAYLRISSYMTKIDEVQLEEGTAETFYEDFYLKINNIRLELDDLSKETIEALAFSLQRQENDDVIKYGLVTRYDFDEGIGTTIEDKVGSDNLEIVGTGNWNALAPDGSQVIKFSGGEYARGKSSQSLGDDYTIMIAFRSDKIAGENYLFEKGKTPNVRDGQGLSVAFRGDALGAGNRATMRIGASQKKGNVTIMQHLINLTGSEQMHKWHMFALVRNGDTIREYLDGALLTQYKSDFDSLDGDIIIGNRHIISSAVDNQIGLYLQYDRALTDGEIHENTKIFEPKFQYETLSETTRRNKAHDLNLPSKPCLVPTYDGAGETVHPKAVYFMNKWNGWKYWLADTPYTTTKPEVENPSIFVSDDGMNWYIPDGVNNPIEEGRDTLSNITNADTHLFYNEPTNELWMYFIQWESDLINCNVYRRKSSDGVIWSAKEIVIEQPYGDRDLNPAVIKVGGTYYMYSYNPNNTIRRRESDDGLNYGNPIDVVLPTHPEEPSNPWHFDVAYNVTFGKYYMVERKETGKTISLYQSDDGVDFSFVKVLFRVTGRLDRTLPYLSVSLYRPSFTRITDSHYKLYFGSLGINENRTSVVDLVRDVGEWLVIPLM